MASAASVRLSAHALEKRRRLDDGTCEIVRRRRRCVRLAHQHRGHRKQRTVFHLRQVTTASSDCSKALAWSCASTTRNPCGLNADLQFIHFAGESQTRRCFDFRTRARFQCHRETRCVQRRGATSTAGRPDGFFSRRGVVRLSRGWPSGSEMRRRTVRARRGRVMLLLPQTGAERVVLNGGGEVVLVKLVQRGDAEAR